MNYGASVAVARLRVFEHLEPGHPREIRKKLFKKKATPSRFRKFLHNSCRIATFAWKLTKRRVQTGQGFGTQAVSLSGRGSRAGPQASVHRASTAQRSPSYQIPAQPSSLLSKEWIEKWNEEWNFSQIPEISVINLSEFFWHFFSRSRDILSFPDHFCEIPANLYQTFAG